MSRFADQTQKSDVPLMGTPPALSKPPERLPVADRHLAERQGEADSPTKSLAQELSALNLDTRRIVVSEASQATAHSAVALAAEAAGIVQDLPELSPSVALQGVATHSRYDAISGRWTIFAAGRDQRPCDFIQVPPREPTAFDCPFCSGNEHQTPQAVLEIDASECDRLAVAADESKAAGREPWVIRVIPNKFPAVDPPIDGAADALARPEGRRGESGSALFLNRAVIGGHEVFIETPDHEQSLDTLDLQQVVMLLRAYQLRLQHWRQVPAVRYLSLFKNVGPAAGASLRHSHSQMIATSELPLAAKAVADRMRFHWARTGCCLQCDTIRAELKDRKRVIATTGSLVAYCPYGSHLPMLVRITTRRHVDCYEDLSLLELEELARLTRGIIRWMQALFPEVAYNYLIHTRPPGIEGEEMSHWSMEIFPRITQVAGFEWSSECMINPVLPEVAATSYREVALKENPLR